MIVFQVMLQFIAQCVAVMMIRKYRKDIHRPYSMPWYPIPAVIALLGWTYILAASGWKYVGTGIALMAAGTIAYLWLARRNAEWPFRSA